MQSALLKDIGKIFKDINEFKQYLTKYNKQLSQELVQRRDLGCYLQLLAKERKKSHKFYIDSIKNITKKQKRANGVGVVTKVHSALKSSISKTKFNGTDMW